jgi:hypothetical protein
VFDLQDADRAVSLDLEADPIVTHAESRVARALEALQVAFTGVAVPCKGMQNLERLFTIDPA